MANAVGGTIVYGIDEGEGDDRGVAVGLCPMPVPPDDAALDNLLRDNVDERLMGVRHRAVPASGGGWYYVVRVPSSHLAPHMVTRKSHRPRFYLRGTTSNDPMTARQIKEVALRADTALSRALDLIERRTAVVRTRAQVRTRRSWSSTNRAQHKREDVALLHLVPLFPPVGGLDLADATVQTRFAQMPMVGLSTVNAPRKLGRFRIALEGLYSEYTLSADVLQYALLLRQGALEYVDHDIVDPVPGEPEGSRGVISTWLLEVSVLEALEHARALTDLGILSLPIVMSLRLLDVVGARLGHRAPAPQSDLPPYTDPDVIIDPLLITDWGADADRAARRLFDTIWQAWGWPESLHYDRSGARIAPR
jgi:hypothetical protein